MTMNKTFAILVMAFALLLSIAFPVIFAINGAMPFATGVDMGIYITDKVIVCGLIIFVGVTIMLGKWNYFISLKVISLTAAIQLLPLFNRLFGLLSYIDDIKKWIWSFNILISLVILFLYVLFVFVLKMNSNRYQKVYEQVKSEEIPVQKTNSYLDENGDLRGPGA